jgi:hypothetical protein
MDYVARCRLIAHSRNSSADAKAGPIKVPAGVPRQIATLHLRWVAIDSITPDNDPALMAGAYGQLRIFAICGAPNTPRAT